MTTGWQTFQLDKIAEIIGGGTPKTSKQEYWGGDIPWLSVVDFNNDRRYVPLKEIIEHGHLLTPGRYVGSEAVEDDDESFAEKMQKLTQTLGEQMTKGAELDALIRQKLGGLGYEF